MDENNKQDRRLDAHDERLDRIERKVDQLLFYLQSDEATGRQGMYAELRSMDERLSRVESAMNASMAKKSVWALVGGAIVTLIVSLDSIVSFIKTLFKS